MRRPSILHALRSLLLLIALTGAVGLGAWQSASCAMHGLGVARGDAPPAHLAGHHDVHAAPSSPASHDGRQPSHDGGSRGCDCTCIGACTMTAPLATAPATVTLRVALIHPEPRVLVDTEPAHAPPVAPDRLLPFGNGPPASPLV